VTRRFIECGCLTLHHAPFEPFLYFGRKLHGRHAGQRRRENFLKVWHRQLGHRLAISGKHGFERFDILEFWLLPSVKDMERCHATISMGKAGNGMMKEITSVSLYFGQ
jgi:hypothetical protein